MSSLSYENLRAMYDQMADSFSESLVITARENSMRYENILRDMDHFPTDRIMRNGVATIYQERRCRTCGRVNGEKEENILFRVE